MEQRPSHDKLSRRTFLKSTGALATVGFFKNGVGENASAQDTEPSNNTSFEEIINRSPEEQIKQLSEAIDAFRSLNLLEVSEEFRDKTSLNFQTAVEPDKFGQPQLTTEIDQSIDLTGPFYFITDVSKGASNEAIKPGKFIGLNEIYPPVNFIEGNDDSGERYIGFNLDAFPIGLTTHDYESEFGPIKAIVYHYAGLSHDQPWFGSGFAGFISTNDTQIWERPANFARDGGTAYRQVDHYGGSNPPPTYREEIEAYYNAIGKGMVNLKSYATQSMADVEQQFQNMPPGVPSAQLSVDAIRQFGKIDEQIIHDLKLHALTSAYNCDYPYVLWRWDNSATSSIADIFPEAAQEVYQPTFTQPEYFLTGDKTLLTDDDIRQLPQINLNRLVTPKPPATTISTL